MLCERSETKRNHSISAAQLNCIPGKHQCAEWLACLLVVQPTKRTRADQAESRMASQTVAGLQRRRRRLRCRCRDSERDLDTGIKSGVQDTGHFSFCPTIVHLLLSFLLLLMLQIHALQGCISREAKRQAHGQLHVCELHVPFYFFPCRCTAPCLSIPFSTRY